MLGRKKEEGKKMGMKMWIEQVPLTMIAILLCHQLEQQHFNGNCVLYS